MGVAVQKGAGQGILRGDGALGQIGGGQSGQQLHNGKAAARFGDRHAQQGRHLAERVWYGTGNGKGNTVPGFQCGAGGRRLQNNGIGLQGGIVADIIDGNGKTGVPQGLDGIGTVLAFQIRYGDGVWPFADGQYEFLPLFDGAARGGLLGDDDAFRLGRVAGIPHDGKLGGALFNLGLLACVAVILMVADFEEMFSRGMDFLAKYTMPIFLMHTLFAAPLRSVLLKVGVTNAVAHVVLGLGISFAGPIIAAWIMKKTKWMEFFLYPNKLIRKVS